MLISKLFLRETFKKQENISKEEIIKKIDKVKLEKFANKWIDNMY